MAVWILKNAGTWPSSTDTRKRKVRNGWFSVVVKDWNLLIDRYPHFFRLGKVDEKWN